jgi:hypothetical protein
MPALPVLPPIRLEPESPCSAESHGSVVADDAYGDARPPNLTQSYHRASYILPLGQKSLHRRKNQPYIMPLGHFAVDGFSRSR